MWHVVDAEGQIVGRLATKIVKLLTGKHKPVFSANSDCGDNVVVLNAHKVVFTGKKGREKLYRWHTGYPGGLKELSARLMFEKHPERILQKAVSGMLPKNRLRKKRLARLRLVNGEDHPFAAQVNFSNSRGKEFLDTVAPVPEYRKQEEDTGMLVRDYPEGDTDEEVARDGPEIEQMFFSALEDWETAGGVMDWGEEGRPKPHYSSTTVQKVPETRVQKPQKGEEQKDE